MKIARFFPAVGWLILSLVLLCLPGSTLPRFSWLALIHADKWVHIALFFILCLLFSLPFSKSVLDKGNRKKWFFLIALSGIAYGTIMEFVQKYWIANRSFELSDIAADSVGCFLACWYSLRNFS